MKRIFDLMRVDIIALGGKKSGAFKAMVIFLIICIVPLILLTPGFGTAMYVFIAAVCVSPIIIEREIKSDYGKTFCILPADRKSVVLARFLLTALLVSGIGILMYLLMRLSLAIGLNTEIMGDISEIFVLLGISSSVSGFYNVLFSAVFTIGIIIMSKQMRNYFKNGTGSKKSSLLRNLLKVILIYILIITAVAVLISASSIPFIQTAFSLIFSILSALSQPADGLLLSLTFFVVGYGTAVYQAVCAVLEYDEREL
ncbi:MAG: ABC-2 transporter permease [Oscillospiraceae bacterium]|nr:ABC-2 transporter permease [Oscillospiraceae bacterium]